MYDVELSYWTMMGQLKMRMHTTETVETHEEAKELRGKLLDLISRCGFEGRVMIKHAKPIDTVDEAFESCKRMLTKYRPIKTEKVPS